MPPLVCPPSCRSDTGEVIFRWCLSLEHPYRPRPRLSARSPLAAHDRLGSRLEQIREAGGRLESNAGAPRAGVLGLAASNGRSPGPGPSCRRLRRGPPAARYRPSLRVNECPGPRNGSRLRVDNSGPRSGERASCAGPCTPRIRPRGLAVGRPVLPHSRLDGCSLECKQEQ